MINISGRHMAAPSVSQRAGCVPSCELLLDGALTHAGTDGDHVVCRVGGRFLVLELPSLAPRQHIPLPPCDDLLVWQVAGGRLYALTRDGRLLSRPVLGESEWVSLKQRSTDLRDIAAAGGWLFRLERSLLICNRIGPDAEFVDEIAMPVPARVRSLCAIPPYVAAFGPSAMWIAAVEAGRGRPVYLDTESFPCPVAVAHHGGEFVIADHLAGLVCLGEGEGGALSPVARDSSVLHPYAMAWDGRAWALATERGFMLWEDGNTEPLEDFSESVEDLSEPVIGLREAHGGLLVARARRLSLHVVGSPVSSYEFPGYVYGATVCDGVVASVTDGGLYLSDSVEPKARPTFVPLPGSARAVAARPPFLYVATTGGFYSLILGSPEEVEFAGKLEGAGEPVSLALDESGARAYLGCGMSLLEVELRVDGSLRVCGETRLGVYPHALAVSEGRLYAACSDGGLLWGETGSPGELKAVAELPFVTDVAAAEGCVAAATAKSLVVFAHPRGGSPVPASKLDGQDDLCACAFDDGALVFAAGRTIAWAEVNADALVEVSQRVEAPFAPRRLTAAGGGVLACGGGGTMFAARGPRT